MGKRTKFQGGEGVKITDSTIAQNRVTEGTVKCNLGSISITDSNITNNIGTKTAHVFVLIQSVLQITGSILQ